MPEGARVGSATLQQITCKGASSLLTAPVAKSKPRRSVRSGGATNPGCTGESVPPRTAYLGGSVVAQLVTNIVAPPVQVSTASTKSCGDKSRGAFSTRCLM